MIREPRAPRGHRWTLRLRLLIALLCLSGLGLAVVAGTSTALLRNSLMQRVDQQIRHISEPWIGGRGPLPGPTRPEDRRHDPPSDFRLVFLDPTGRQLSAPWQGLDASGPRLPKLDQAHVAAHNGVAFTADDSAGGNGWRVRAVVLPTGQTAVVAMSLASLDSTVGQLLTIELVVGGVVLVLVGVAAMTVVRLGLRPLTRIEATAEAIAAGDLDRRVPDTDSRTETGRLGQALNTMLGRLADALRQRERSEDRLRRFVGDASHELRTPLTSIRGFAELYRRAGATDPADVARMMSRIESEAIRMGLLVEDLLLLARLDQQRALDFTDVDLVPLAQDAVHDARAREPEREISLLSPANAVRVIGDEHRLRQVVTNLVTNALTHTPAGTAVRVTVDNVPASNGHGPPAAAAGAPLPLSESLASLEVQDEGPGVSPAEANRVFDRFYRADPARSRKRGGAGLGLAISAAILEAHNGRIELYSPPHSGATFRVLLPPA